MTKRIYFKLLGYLFFTYFIITPIVGQVKINVPKVTNNLAKKQAQKEAHFVCAKVPERHSEEAVARNVATKYALWEVGQTIKVRFLNGSTALQDTVKHFANEWIKYANLNVEFVDTGQTNIRISFIENSVVSWSYIGSFSRYAEEDKPTMVLALSDSSSYEALSTLILHEFGHALGLFHEHQHPENGIQWNRLEVYDYYAQIGWSERLIENYVFFKFSQSITQYCDYDSASVMHYPIPPNFTLDSFSVGLNNSLSKGDTNFIKKLYPLDGIRNSADLCKAEIDSVNVDSLNVDSMNINEGDGGTSAKINLGSTTPKVFPNPFTDNPLLAFSLAEKKVLEVRIIDINGRQIYRQRQLMEAGAQQLKLPQAVFAQRGTYFYQLIGDDYMEMGKMMKL